MDGRRFCSSRVVSRVGLLATLLGVMSAAIAAPKSTPAMKPGTRPAPSKSGPAGVKKPMAPAPTAELRLAPLPDGSRDAAPEFTLTLTDDQRAREVKSVGGKAQVAPGVYWITRWSVTTADAQGRKWHVRGGVQGMPPARSRIELRAGQRVQIALGAPLGVTVNPRVLGRTVKMTMYLFGSLGDRCYDVSIEGKRPPRPSVSIVDAAGKVVDRLDFSFG
jgi:hypothetical protein